MQGYMLGKIELRCILFLDHERQRMREWLRVNSIQHTTKVAKGSLSHSANVSWRTYPQLSIYKLQVCTLDDAYCMHVLNFYFFTEKAVTR